MRTFLKLFYVFFFSFSLNAKAFDDVVYCQQFSYIATGAMAARLDGAPLATSLLNAKAHFKEKMAEASFNLLKKTIVHIYKFPLDLFIDIDEKEFLKNIDDITMMACMEAFNSN